MGAQIVGFVVTFIAVFVAAWFLGKYMFKVFRGERTLLSPVLRPVERGCYRVMGVDEQREQSWVGYLVVTLLVTVMSVLFTYVILRLQDRLPFQGQLNPNHLPAVPADLALNTAISFATNTNWQNYAGEPTMSYLSQMRRARRPQVPLGGDAGIALAMALIRGLAAPQRTDDRQLLGRSDPRHPLHPAAALGRRRLVLVSQGAIQNLNGYTTQCTPWKARDADHRPGPGRLARRRSRARHQRRRLLQRQLRPPLREPQLRSPTSSRSC